MNITVRIQICEVRAWRNLLISVRKCESLNYQEWMHEYEWMYVSDGCFKKNNSKIPSQCIHGVQR